MLASPWLGCESVGVTQDHFGEDVAARYDQDEATMFAPEVLGPTV